ncbi:DNA repair protein RecN [Schnuerera sp. xch1]|uniref:DNA repair protein RecN n=1 Tax=Schnuerera sp. xch1 TaxID=2874283 RepID=UPI001CBC4E67|nr:DNA repair protein RecN [Schnuerera sp. xch1]MBZ2173761.1 DNA repair protein RecN [Schnuerera sp. xch1]
MIVELKISNFAIIDNLKINFEKGFNVLTGETGAGKSIIIEGIGMLLGQRASRDLIRTGKEKAILEGVFYLENPVRVNRILKEYGIDIDPDNNIVISREIHKSGRTISRVNGRSITLTTLNNITSNLIDIHGQYEHQSLLNVNNHIMLVDAFGDVKLRMLLDDIKEMYKKIQIEKEKLKELSLNTIDKEREIDLLKYQLDEIDSVNLSKFKEEEVINEYNKLDNIKEIGYTLSEVLNIINSEDYNEFVILNCINKCITKMNKIKEYDDNLKQYNDLLESIGFELQDLSRSIMDYLDNLEIDENRFKFLKDRIDSINKLKKKYGNTIEDIINYRNLIENKLRTLLDNEKIINKINDNIDLIEKKLYEYCSKLTGLRKKLSKKIELLVTKELRELNMNNVSFKINFNKLDYFTPRGWDEMEFLISTNEGEDMKPLSKIVSGGEMSRIMLAFKRILAEYDNIPCLIFDEIDSGISGRTAQIVGEKIKKISQNHQVICISHLPQIAALGDAHFVLEKFTNKGKTKTNIKKLDYKQRIEELSRLLGGVNLTNTTKLHAKEMLDMSKKL